MAANYQHIGGHENRLGRHYSRFSAFWSPAALTDQSLALRKSQNAGSNGRSRASSGSGSDEPMCSRQACGGGSVQDPLQRSTYIYRTAAGGIVGWHEDLGHNVLQKLDKIICRSGGRYLCLRWRKDIDPAWLRAPALYLDAAHIGSFEIAKAWLPDLVLKLEATAKAPHQRVVQLVESQMSYRKLLSGTAGGEPSNRTTKLPIKTRRGLPK
jgi:hypothetical protein